MLLMVIKELLNNFMSFIFHDIEYFEIILDNLIDSFIG